MSDEIPKDRQGELWVDRTSRSDPRINQNMVQYLRLLIDASTSVPPHVKGGSRPLPLGGRLVTGREDVTIYSGSRAEFLDIFAATMKVIVGASTEDVKEEHRGELENRVIRFPGDISIVYMLSRGDGISINLPRKFAATLAQKMDALGLPQLKDNAAAQGA